MRQTFGLIRGISVFLILLCSLLNSSQSRAQTAANTLAQKAASLSPGQWVLLNQGGDGSGYGPSVTDSGVGTIYAYAGKATYDPLRRRVFFLGAGHGALLSEYKYLVYEIEKNQWTQLPTPNWVTSFANFHAYELQTVAPGQFFRVLANSYKIYVCNINQDSIANIGGGNCPGDYPPIGDPNRDIASRAALEYFPQRNSLFFIDSGTGRLLEKSLSSPDWSLIADGFPDWYGDGYAAAYNPTQKAIVLGGGASGTTAGAYNRKWWKYDANGTLSRIDDAPINIYSSSSALFFADPGSRKFILMRPDDATATKVEVYELDITNSPGTQWGRRADLETGIPLTTYTENPIFATVSVPLPEYGVTMFMTHDRVYLYKHSAGTGTPVPVDVTPPTISALTSSGLTSSSVIVSWTTNENSDTQVEYGLSTSYGTTTTLNSSLSSIHSPTISGLNPGTLYHYRARSRDASGNLATSADNVFTTSPITLQAPTTQPGLVLAYSFDAGSGTTVVDLSGNNNNGTLNNNPTWAPGKYGASLNFNGNGQFVSTTFTSQLHDFTVCAWVNPKAVNVPVARILDKKFDTGFWMGLSGSAATWGGGIEQTSSPYGSFPYGLPAGTWSYLCLLRTGTTKYLYLNGGAVSSENVSGTALDNSPLMIGKAYYPSTDPGYFFNGLIDELRIYNRALSSSEIQADMWTPVGGSVQEIAGVSATGIGLSTATITWISRQQSDSQVEYGITTSYGASSTLNSTLVTSHSVTLSGLNSSTLYHFRVRSRNGSGTLSVSDDYTLTTAATLNQKCAQSGVIGCWSFDSSTAVRTVPVQGTSFKYIYDPGLCDAAGLGARYGLGDDRIGANDGNVRAYEQNGVCVYPTIDTTMTHSGSGSLKISVPSNSNEGTGGWFTDVFGRDAAGNATGAYIGPMSPLGNVLWVQWYQRFDSELLNALFNHYSLASSEFATSGSGSTTLISPSGEFKPSMLGESVWFIGGRNFILDRSFTITAVINSNTVTLSSSPTPAGAGSGGIGYVSGGGGGAGWKQAIWYGNPPYAQSGSLSIVNADTSLRGVPQSYVRMPEGSGVQDFGVQDVRGCVYTGGLPDTYTEPPCIRYKPNQWMEFTFRMEIKGSTPDTPTSHYQMWVDGEIVQDLDNVKVNWGQGDGDGYGAFQLIEHITGKDPNQAHSTGHTWYDDLVVSTQPIPMTKGAIAGVTSPPAISITAPSGGSVVSGASVTVAASVNTGSGIAGVQFQLDGVNLGSEIANAPYTVVWNTGLTSNGSHTLTAVARDGAGNQKISSPVTVTVNNVTDTIPPTVSITAPGAGSTVLGVCNVSASVADNVGVVAVQFKIDDINLGSELTTSPYSVLWDTTTISDGPHFLVAIARDAAGNVSRPFQIGVTVRNSVTRTAPPQELKYSVPDNGAQHWNSTNTLSSVTTGYARIQPDAGSSTPAANAIFGLRTGGVLVTETSVPASPLVQSGRFFLDINGPINTGVAIVNPNNQDIGVYFYFTDAAGNNFGAGSFTLEANRQVSAFLNESPFNAGSSREGTFTFSSSLPVSAVAIRGHINERNEFLMSTLPVSPLGTGVGGVEVVPHFVTGGGWETQIVLVNPTDTILTGSIEFFGQGFDQLLTMSVNQTTSSSFSYSIPPRGVSRLIPAGLSTALQAGSVRISATDGGILPSAVAIVSLKRGPLVISETSVPAQLRTSALRAYVESSGTFGQIGSVETGLALANPVSSPVVAKIELARLDGTPTGLSASVTIPANGQLARFLHELVPGLPAEFSGVLRVTTTMPIAMICLRGRYNARGDFLFTPTPPAAETVVSSNQSLLFPLIVTGGGYSTDLAIFGRTTGQPASGEVIFFSNDGTPVVWQ